MLALITNYPLGCDVSGLEAKEILILITDFFFLHRKFVNALQLNDLTEPYTCEKFCLSLNCKTSKKKNNSISPLFDASNIISGRSHVCHISSFISCITSTAPKSN